MGHFNLPATSGYKHFRDSLKREIAETNSALSGQAETIRLVSLEAKNR
jgi:hypothetical protein